MTTELGKTRITLSDAETDPHLNTGNRHLAIASPIAPIGDSHRATLQAAGRRQQLAKLHPSDDADSSTAAGTAHETAEPTAARAPRNRQKTLTRAPRVESRQALRASAATGGPSLPVHLSRGPAR